MQVELVNPFLSATCDVFRTMLSCQIRRGPVGRKDGRAPQYEVSGLIGLSGKCQGMVVVSLGRQTALQAASILLAHEATEINADVVDAVGEMTNMIAGAAKAQLAEYELSVGLPTVICGRHHSISFPSGSTPIVMPFESDIGPMSVEVGLAQL
jgi:chemotaxis protein CheX